MVSYRETWVLRLPTPPSPPISEVPLRKCMHGVQTPDPHPACRSSSYTHRKLPLSSQPSPLLCLSASSSSRASGVHTAGFWVSQQGATGSQWLLFLDQQEAAEATTSGSRTLTSQALHLHSLRLRVTTPLPLSTAPFPGKCSCHFLKHSDKNYWLLIHASLIINAIMAPCFVSHSSIHAPF